MLQIARENSAWRLVLLLPLLCVEMSTAPLVKAIGAGLYAYISDNDSSSNATFLVGSKGILVVDTGFDGQEGGKLLQAIRGVSNLPVQFIVNTHYHRDHQGGNSVVGPSAVVISTDYTRERTLAVIQSSPAAERSLFRPAGLTFHKKLTIYLEPYSAEVYFPGKAHTSGDALVYFPEQRAIAMGDLFLNRSSPAMDDGSAENWIRALDQVLARPLAAVVPGHFELPPKLSCKPSAIISTTFSPRCGLYMKNEPPWKRYAAVFAWRSTATSASIPSSMRPSRTTRKRYISSFNNAEPAMLGFPIEWVRASFPALHTGDKFVFFDNGAGAQVPQIVLDAVHDHLLKRNVQRGGRYRRSQEVDEAIQHGRESVATFLNARDPREVAFGMNATSFIRIVSLALADTLRERKEIIVCEMDHEANVATWLALQRHGVQIRWWRVCEDGTLHLADLEPLLNSKTRLVACTAASNALGSIVDVKEVSRLAHAVGAEVFLDAVHYAPHGPIDVQDLDCDYLVCSGYKIFAPHMGFLWGKRPLLEALPTFREDFIPDDVPAKLEVGTFVYENVAGMDAAITYLEELGARVSPDERPPARRFTLVQAMESIRNYEARLSTELLRALAELHGVTVYGIHEPCFAERRVPTVCFNVRGVPPSTVASKLAGKSIGVRDGNMYSPRLLKRLGISEDSGAVRASLAHYNTLDEIDRFISELRKIARN